MLTVKQNLIFPTHGFSLIELLLSIAVLSILVSASTPLILPAYHRHQLIESTGRLEWFLRTAQTYASRGNDDDSWGVAYVSQTTPQKIYLFKGSDFAHRDESYDDIYVINPTITITGIPDIGIIFERGTGNTNPSTIMVNSNILHKDFTLIISDIGLIDVQAPS